MEKRRKRIIALTMGILGWLLAVTGAWGQASGSDEFMPAWEAGMTWTMKVVYTAWNGEEKMDVSEKTIFLKYRVREKIEEAGELFWVIDVSTEKKDWPFTATLYYRAGDLSLAQAEVEKRIRGKTIRESYRFGIRRPVAARFVQIPVDSPVFPLIGPSRASYELEREIGDGLKIRKVVVQEVKPVPGKGGETALEVTCRDEEGKVMFMQRWEKGKPWAMEGKSENMKYWMVGP